MKARAAAWIAIYFLMWMVTWPAFLADLQSYKDIDYAQECYRKDLAAAIGFGLLPTTWILTPFATGFYEHGLQIGRRKE